MHVAQTPIILCLRQMKGEYVLLESFGMSVVLLFDGLMQQQRCQISLNTHTHSKYYNSEQRSPDVSVCLWVIYPEDGTMRVISHMPCSLFNYCLTLQEGSSSERCIGMLCRF